MRGLLIVGVAAGLSVLSGFGVTDETVYAWRGEKRVVWQDQTNRTAKAVLVRPTCEQTFVRVGVARQVRGDNDILYADRVDWGGAVLVGTGETCAATTYPPPQGAAKRLATRGVALGIVVFFCATYAAATFRTTHSDPCGAALRPVDTVMSAFVHMDVRPSTDATLAKCRCVVARAEKKILYHSAGVVDTRHFAKIRVSQGDLN